MQSSVQQQQQGRVGPHNSYPLHHSERQAWRGQNQTRFAAAEESFGDSGVDRGVPSLSLVVCISLATQPTTARCSAVTGSAPSSRPDPNSPQADPITTVWHATKMVWEPGTGKIKGEGVSLWQDQSIPFSVLGAFTPNFSSIEMIKRHHSTGGVTHMVFSVDLQSLTLTGHFANGGTCTLQRGNGNNISNGGGVGGVGFPLHMQRSLSNTSGGSVGPALDAPKDLLTFLSYCFSDSPGIAAKIHATLHENEIHDPTQLTTLSHEEWKELGVVLGHRSKIKLQLQRFFPHLMKMNPDEGPVPSSAASPDELCRSSCGGCWCRIGAAIESSVSHAPQYAARLRDVGPTTIALRLRPAASLRWWCSLQLQLPSIDIADSFGILMSDFARNHGRSSAGIGWTLV